jgi:hypothetical protein
VKGVRYTRSTFLEFYKSSTRLPKDQTRAFSRRMNISWNVETYALHSRVANLPFKWLSRVPERIRVLMASPETNLPPSLCALTTCPVAVPQDVINCGAK